MDLLHSGWAEQRAEKQDVHLGLGSSGKNQLVERECMFEAVRE